MRAFIVEFTGADDRDTVEGRARDASADAVPVGARRRPARATDRAPVSADPDEGEPA